MQGNGNTDHATLNNITAHARDTLVQQTRRSKPPVPPPPRRAVAAVPPASTVDLAPHHLTAHHHDLDSHPVRPRHPQELRHVPSGPFWTWRSGSPGIGTRANAWFRSGSLWVSGAIGRCGACSASEFAVSDDHGVHEPDLRLASQSWRRYPASNLG